ACESASDSAAACGRADPDSRQQYWILRRGVMMGRGAFMLAVLVLKVALAADSTAFVPDELGHTVDTGARVDARLPDGSTALQWAVYRGEPSEVQRLIHAGANVSVANNYGATAMSIAAEAGDATIIRLLLKAGADPDSANAEGQTALMSVARTG